MIAAHLALVLVTLAALAYAETHKEWQCGNWTLGFDATRWERQFLVEVRVCQPWDFARFYGSALSVALFGYGVQLRMWRPTSSWRFRVTPL